MQRMEVQELKATLESPERNEVNFIDVRERAEWESARIDGFSLYPLSEAQNWTNTLANDVDKGKTTVVLCKVGVRSANACGILLHQLGWEGEVFNVVGGIDAYRKKIDPTLPSY